MAQVHKNFRCTDLVCNWKVFPQYDAEAKIEIEHFLGYLPASEVTLVYEPYLRALIHQRRSGNLSQDQFDKVAEEHVRLIRNEEVKHNLMPDYHEGLYNEYHSGYYPYGKMARDRIVNILGYSPELSRSLLSELYLRQLMKKQNVVLPDDKLTSFDFKLIGLIRYREALLAKGKSAADNLPCLKCEPDWHDTGS